MKQIHVYNAPLVTDKFENKATGNEEVWLSLTSPLKHQLSIAAVKCIDNAMDIRSVNTLRWDGITWWAGSSDGRECVWWPKLLERISRT